MRGAGGEGIWPVGSEPTPQDHVTMDLAFPGHFVKVTIQEKDKLVTRGK